jgi:hypothetical protein
MRPAGLRMFAYKVLVHAAARDDAVATQPPCRWGGVFCTEVH